MKAHKIANKRATALWTCLSMTVFIYTNGFCQTAKLDTNALENTMRNPITYDRAQYVSQWLVLGNIPAKWNEGIDKDFLANEGGEASITPEEGKQVKLLEGKELTWRKLANAPQMIDFKDVYGDPNTKNNNVENLVRYAYGVIYSNNARKSLLTVGSDDGIKVWLNGRLVHRNMVYRRIAPDQDLIEVNLIKGENYLLIKTVQTVWSNRFIARIIDDANVTENTLQKLQFSMTDYPANKTFTLKSPALVNTITKQQPVQLKIYNGDGKTLFDKTIMRGDSVSLNYSLWNDGPYEIKYTYYNLNNLSCTDYMNWFKGDVLKMAEQVVKTSPDKSVNTSEAITHRMLADFINYRIDGNFKTNDPYKISLTYPLLMEFEEMKSGNQIRPGGFVRLAYIDDIDGTPQFCRCYIPWDYDPSKKSALIVFLHGNNPENPDYIRWWWADKRHDANVDRYNFIFIEPHGRGNTQYTGIGDRDVIKCIQLAKEKLNIDDDRVYLTGASMGGAGTWRVASVHPSMFAAISPVFGGWDHRIKMSKEDRTKISEEEDFIQDKTYSTTCQFEALLNLPILALHGDNDNNVNVENSRYLVRMLQRWGYNVRYIEVPGKGHEDLGKDDIIYPWLLQHTRNKDPKHVKLRAPGLRTASAYWVAVSQYKEPMKMINVDAEVLANNIIRVNSENVLEMVLSPGEKLVLPDQSISVIWNGEIITYDKSANGTLVLKSKELGTQKLHKTPAIAGPNSDFTNTPFAVVTGTISKDSLMQRVVDLKTKGFLSYWKNTQRFKPRFFKDTEISAEDLKKYSLFLIGGPKENKISKQIIKSLPVDIKSNTISIDHNEFSATNAALEIIYPSPFNEERYIRMVAPTSYEGLYFYDFNHRELSQYDFSITDGRIINPAILEPVQKAGAVKGFFDTNWKVDTSYLRKMNIKNNSKDSVRRRVGKDFKVQIETTVTPSLAVLNSYVGTFKIDQQNRVFKVILDNNTLLIQTADGFKFESKAISETEFILKGIDAILSFQRDAQNNIVYVNLYEGSNMTRCSKVKD